MWSPDVKFGSNSISKGHKLRQSWINIYISVNYYTILTDKTKELARGQKSLQEGGCPLATGSWPIPMLAPANKIL